MSGSGNSEFIDYYGLLKISPDSDLGQIRAGYLNMAKRHHPDVGGTIEQMKLLNTAYKTLVDSISRQAYDKLYNLHKGGATGLHLKDDYVHKSSSYSQMDDDYVDYFLDSVFAEFSDKTKPKKDIKKQFKKIFKQK